MLFLPTVLAPAAPAFAGEIIADKDLAVCRTEGGHGIAARCRARRRSLCANFQPSQPEEEAMVTAIVLLTIARGRVAEVAEQLAGLEEISEVYSVAGRYDLVAMVRVKSNEALADVVTTKLQRVEGIETTETLIAFRAYSRMDLEGVFSLGFEKR
jgi:DNA-binding Lrp family transcriptional regulator